MSSVESSLKNNVFYRGTALRKTIPHNKQLKLHELAALARYHDCVVWKLYSGIKSGPAGPFRDNSFTTIGFIIGFGFKRLFSG